MKSLSNQAWKADAERVHRYILKPEDTLLLAMDIQEWPYTTMESTCRDTFLKNCRIILKASRAMRLPVMVSELSPERFGPTIGEIEELVGDVPKITKNTGSCWREGRVRAGIKAKGRNTVLIIGMEAHLAVLQTVMDLLQTGYNPVVAADAVFSRAPAHAETALTAMAHAGAVVYPAETIAYMLLDRPDPGLCGEIMSLSHGDQPPEAMNG